MRASAGERIRATASYRGCCHRFNIVCILYAFSLIVSVCILFYFSSWLFRFQSYSLCLFLPLLLCECKLPVLHFGQFLLCDFRSHHIFHIYMGFVVFVVDGFFHCLVLKFDHCLVEKLLSIALSFPGDRQFDFSFYFYSFLFRF